MAAPTETARSTVASRGPGRPRDPAIDLAVITVAQRHLAEHGYEAMSLAAIADEAGTTRQALYRRYPSKADLATAAIAAIAAAEVRADSDDPYADLVAELEAFRVGVLRPNGIAMVGTMLQAGVDDELARLYRERIVLPRRARLRSILRRAVTAGRLPSSADLDTAVAACTGTLYGARLADSPIPDDWAARVAALVWRGCGGTVPTGRPTRRSRVR
jgi:AcrR family transcriptional regulator